MSLPKLKQWSLDAITGPLTLSGAPTEDLHAATKKYVDDNAGGGAITVNCHKNGTNQTGFSGFSKVTLSNGDGAGSAWFSDANDRVTVPSTGIYLVEAQIAYSGGISAGNLLLSMIYKNGSNAARRDLPAPSAADVSVPVVAVLSLSENDYLELWGYKETSTTVLGNVYQTRMSVTRLA